MWNNNNKCRGTFNVFDFFTFQHGLASTLKTNTRLPEISTDPKYAQTTGCPITKKERPKSFLSLSIFCGRWRIRTADPLLVRQTLWTSWAKRPLLVGMTRLERATTWSQTKYTTNCTTSRFQCLFGMPFSKSTAKVRLFFELAKEKATFFTHNMKIEDKSDIERIKSAVQKARWPTIKERKVHKRWHIQTQKKVTLLRGWPDY